MGDSTRTLQDEARYRRERLELYRARYAGRAGNHDKLADLARTNAPAREETTQ